MATAKKLPKLLSEGIRVALKDLAWIEAHPAKYEVHMDTWHTPRFDYVDRPTRDNPYNQVQKLEVCEVCFAGSVMARTLKSKPTEELSLYSFSNKVRGKLAALDAIRKGNVHAAIYGWYGAAAGERLVEELKNNPLVRFDETYDEVKNVTVTEYDEDPGLWRADMERIAAGLERLGL